MNSARGPGPLDLKPAGRRNGVPAINYFLEMSDIV